jgi:ATP-dependent RNA helicase RhlE
MLDMGFIHDIRRILKLLPAKRQNLLFSATFPEEVRTLAAGFMHDAVTVEIARRNLPIELISQVAHPVDKDRKRQLLAHLVKSGNWQQVLVFCKTKHGANRLADQLETDGIETAVIHGNKSQPQRMKALKRFKDCELQVLVATDIAARGIDIESLPHVVNYDLPHVSEDYVHRIGRTGRAGETGQAVSLVSGEDRTLLRDIERLIGKQIEQQIIPGFEPGSGYRNAQPEPQQRRGNRPQNQARRPDRNRSAQRSQGNGQQRSERGGRPQSPSQPRQGNGQRRDHGRRPDQRSAPAAPSGQGQQTVQQQQLEHHRRQTAEEPQSPRPRELDRRSPTKSRLFGWAGVA